MVCIAPWVPKIFACTNESLFQHKIDFSMFYDSVTGSDYQVLKGNQEHWKKPVIFGGALFMIIQSS